MSMFSAWLGSRSPSPSAAGGVMSRWRTAGWPPATITGMGSVGTWPWLPGIGLLVGPPWFTRHPASTVTTRSPAWSPVSAQSGCTAPTQWAFPPSAGLGRVYRASSTPEAATAIARIFASRAGAPGASGLRRAYIAAPPFSATTYSPARSASASNAPARSTMRFGNDQSIEWSDVTIITVESQRSDRTSSSTSRRTCRSAVWSVSVRPSGAWPPVRLPVASMWPTRSTSPKDTQRKSGSRSRLMRSAVSALTMSGVVSAIGSTARSSFTSVASTSPSPVRSWACTAMM
jgi:hypothetical protein